MAYKGNDLSVPAYANGFTYWHYLTDDDPDAVTGECYFNGAHDMIREGDMIHAVCVGDDGVSAVMAFVTKNKNGVVEISVMAKG